MYVTHSMLLARRMLVCLLLLSSTSRLRAADNWRELMTLLPESTNAVLAIDVASLLDSSLAKSNHWSEPLDPTLGAQLTRLPPDAKRFVLTVHVTDHMAGRLEMVDRAVRTNTEEDCKVQSEHCKLGIDLASFLGQFAIYISQFAIRNLQLIPERAHLGSRKLPQVAVSS